MKTEQLTENPMRKIKLEKVVLSCGATGQDLDKAQKLLELLSGKKAQRVTSAKRIPDFNVHPGLEVGVCVTLRREKAKEILRKLLGAISNTLDEDQIAENTFSFGIPEYIEIPGVEYQREIGIRGLNVTVVFARAGIRVRRRKIKKGSVPHKQHVTEEEIISYMEENFETRFT